MTIAAKRFKFLDLETNLPTIDLLNIKNTDVYNAAKESISELTVEVNDFLKIPKIDDIIKPITNVNDKLERLSKDVTGNLKDISKFSTKDVDNILVDLFPDNSIVRSIAAQMTDKCKTKAFGNETLGKPYSSTVDCNGKKRKTNASSCSTSQFANMLNKLTGGNYNASFNDVNNALKAIIALSKLGYDFNMCGVFSSLMGMIPDKGILGKAAGQILGHVAAVKNVKAMLDIVTGSTELNVRQGSRLMLNNFSIPNDVKEFEYTTFINTVCEGASGFDDTWNVSSLDAIPSIAIIDSYSPVLDKVMTSRRLTNMFSPLELDEVVDDDCDFMSVAYILKKEQTGNFRVFT